MKITHRRLPRVDILALTGPFEASTAVELESRVEQLVAERRVRLIFDLAHVEHMSSPALRILIEARRRAQQARAQGGGYGDLRLTNAGPVVRHILAHTGFRSYFTIYDELVEAVASY